MKQSRALARLTAAYVCVAWRNRRYERMVSPQPMAAVNLPAGHSLSVLGQAFRRLYRFDEDPAFDELLARIDAAERDCRSKAEWTVCPG